ncbi:MAG: diguanylate cyclase [Myxococcales bacterium]|nr:diguanylate cyclase [Myxococcales bacterium]
MDRVYRFVLRLSGTARLWLGYLAVLTLGLPVVFGAFLPQRSSANTKWFVFGTAWLGIFFIRVVQRFREEDAHRAKKLLLTGRQAQRAFYIAGSDLELGLLLMVAVHAIIQLGGGLGSPLHPLMYVLLAVATAFSQKRVGMTLVVAALLLESILYFVTEEHLFLRPFLLYASFLFFFGLTNWLFIRVELSRMRERSNQELTAAKARDLEDARMFRLVTAPTSAEKRDDERLFRSSVEEVHQAVFHLLSLLRQTLSLHTCILLMRDATGDRLQIVELSTDSDQIVQGQMKIGEGAVGAVIERNEVLNLPNLKPLYRGLCYYERPIGARAFLGVPVVEHGHIQGVLCADRLTDRPFTSAEEQIMQEATRQILRTLENERVFVQLEQSKYEQTVLHRASQALGAAVSESDVLDAAIQAASEIAVHDFCAVTTYDPTKRRHRIERVVGLNLEHLATTSFSDNTSLTAMVVKTGHYLPYRGEYDEKQQVIFTKRIKLGGLRSLLILPLTVADKTLGTLALGASRKFGFPAAARTTLHVLANQLAVSLSNAQSVKRLEDLATTDGLTGCLNKRAFLQEMEQRFRSAQRFKRKLSLVITDLDHFKSINDTYGHAAGDKVIKGLGEILKNMKRETDIVGRFGGEEFCLLCEETDTAGAMLLAERVREEIESTRFNTETGFLTVTCSVGVATYPRDAVDEEGLFESADRALYAAKHAGRNRVCAAA